MMEVQRVIDAPIEHVWSVLADGWLYAAWVVGTPHIRDVDDGWPQPGTLLHHSTGMWPVLINDITEVREADPPRLLVLKPRLWPLGRGIITLQLTEVERNRTRITFGEDFDRGPLRWALVKGNDLLLYRRNKEALSRLADLAVHREGARA